MPQHPHHELDVHGRGHQPLPDQVGQVVQVPHVVGLELGLHLILPDQPAQMFEIEERVLEDEVLGRLQVLRLLTELPLPVFLQRLLQAEVDRPEVEGTHLGGEAGHVDRALLHGQRFASPGGHADDHVRAPLDARHDLLEHFRGRGGRAVFRVPGVDVHDRGLGLRRLHRRIDDVRGFPRWCGVKDGIATALVMAAVMMTGSMFTPSLGRAQRPLSLPIADPFDPLKEVGLQVFPYLLAAPSGLHSRNPRPLLKPSSPCSTLSTSSGDGPGELSRCLRM